MKVKTGRCMLSTPSLGITLWTWASLTTNLTPFNSLSRDHSLTYLLNANVRLSELSTPSLGITEPRPADPRHARDRAFNSLSRDHSATDIWVTT